MNGAANFESHILPNYYNLIKFTPDVTGYYDITGNYKDGNTSNLGISVYEIGSGVTHLNMGNPIKTSAGGKVTSVWMESGKSYFIKSDLMAGNLAEGFYYGDFSLNFKREAKLIDEGNNGIEFDDNGYSYVKVQADGNYYYAFNTGGINVVTTDENMNVIDSLGAEGVKLESGEIQYFRLERASGSAGTEVIRLEKRRKLVFKYGNGQEDETVWVVEGHYPALPSPTRDGYRSYGWKEEGETEDKHVFDRTLPDIDKADIVLVVDWVKKYKVHYVTNGGSALPDDEFDERWSGGLNMDSVKTHYLFVGWYTDPNFSDDSGPINSFPLGTNTDQTVYAKWEIHEFAITFSSDGRVVQSIVVSKGGTITSPSISKDYHRGMWRSSMRNFITPGASYTCKGYNENFYMEWEVISPYTEKTYVRNSTYTITDSGVFNQNYDNVFSFTKGQANIYSTVKIVVQFTAWEKDDGYQHVMLYDGSGSGATLLAEQKFEHGGNKKDTTAKRYEFTFELDMSKLANKSLCVRYSASGFGADTWYNNAMTCSVTYYE